LICCTPGHIATLAAARRLWTGETVTHEGEHFTVHNARIFSLPETPPDILISGFGPAATELAAQIGDGWITTGSGEDELRGYRDFGGTGRTQVGMKICWAASEDEAAETAYRLWGHEGYGGQLSQDLPMWQGFEALKEQADPAAMKESVPCGPDPERAAKAIREKAEAGYDEVYIAQMGPDQTGGIRFLAEQVLPLVRR
jgi:G6PDH family F420-dependent oxidoreductase